MTLFWHGLIRYEGQKVNPRLALRNALGIGIPLAVGVALGQSAGGLMASIGALDVAYSDGSDPYQFRARRMMAASLLVALAVFGGGIAGHFTAARLVALGACAFATGMMVAVGQIATDIANITLVTVIVFSAHPLGLREAALSGLAALAGGLFQTTLTLALWPLNRRVPERLALAAFYRELARCAAAAKDLTTPAAEDPVASAQSTEAQNSLAGLGEDSSTEAARYLLLLSQAERIRLALMALTRLRIRLAREGGQPESELIGRALARTASILETVGGSIATGEAIQPQGIDLAGIPAHWPAHARNEAADQLAALSQDARWQLQALAGQLRSAVELAGHVTPSGVMEFARRETQQPWTLRLSGALAALRANLCPASGTFRHAVRLAVVVPAADFLATTAGWPRGYWAAMTAAIVLRPDFASTFTRGLLRIAGTLIGLGLATALFHFLAPPTGWQEVLLAVFAFLLRCYGPANYGIFAILLTALIVLLLAATGISPAEVIVPRGGSTIAGGALALLAYWLWPTWERSQVTDVLAQLLDAYRLYFRAVWEGYLNRLDARALDRTRLAARLARSNLEASIGRLRGEPGGTPVVLERLNTMVANTLRFIHAVMALESGLYRSRPVPARQPFQPFAEQVDLALYFLAAALRGSPLEAAHLPDLREYHRTLVEASHTAAERYALVDVETDRITNSVNTLAKEILDWPARPR